MHKRYVVQHRYLYHWASTGKLKKLIGCSYLRVRAKGISLGTLGLTPTVIISREYGNPY